MVSESLRSLLARALSTLRDLGSVHAVIGGIALNVHERIRATRDLDVLVALAPDGFPAIRDALKAAGFAHLDASDRVRLPDVEVHRFWFPVGSTGFSLKLEIIEGHLPFHQQVLARRVEVDAFGLRVPVASREDVILLKLLAGRPIDRLDASELVRLHRPRLDRAYLASTADTLGLAREWAELEAAGDATDAI